MRKDRIKIHVSHPTYKRILNKVEKEATTIQILDIELKNTPMNFNYIDERRRLFEEIRIHEARLEIAVALMDGATTWKGIGGNVEPITDIPCPEFNEDEPLIY